MSAIDPKGIRVGDRVKYTRTYPSGDVMTREFVVKEVTSDYIDGDDASVYVPAPGAWELLDRPVPEIPVGTIVYHSTGYAVKMPVVKRKDGWYYTDTGGRSSLGDGSFGADPVIYSPEAAS